VGSALYTLGVLLEALIEGHLHHHWKGVAWIGRSAV